MKTHSAVPEHYTLRCTRTASLAIRKSYASALLAQGIEDPETLVRRAGTRQAPAGRGRVAVIDIHGFPGQQMLIRTYLRGGLLGKLNRDLYLGRTRPFEELCITDAAARQGLPAPDILAAVSIRAAGPLYRGYLFSRMLPGCRDLPDRIKTLNLKAPEDQQVLETLITASADLIRRMHQKGLYHGDLNLKNILADTRDPRRLHIIDWDKSYLKPALSLPERRQNVVRFCRSMRKFMHAGLGLTEQHLRLFLTCYWQEPGVCAPHTDRCVRYLRRASLLRAVVKKLARGASSETS